MPFNSIIPAQGPLGGSIEVWHAPLDLTVAFEKGDLCFINEDGQIEGFPIDGTQALVGDIGGSGLMACVAAWGPGRAATAEFVGNAVRINPDTGVAFVADDKIGYFPVHTGQRFKAQVLATGGAAAGTGLATHRGEIFQMAYSAGTTPDLGWGVELTAAVLDTDMVARVIEVIADDGRVTETAGTHFIFEISTELP